VFPHSLNSLPVCWRGESSGAHAEVREHYVQFLRTSKCFDTVNSRRWCVLSKARLIVVGGALLLAVQGRFAPLTAQQQGQNSPSYTAEGRLLLPTAYREWVYLSSGVNMSYGTRRDSVGSIHE
jgi:hypothetical protein